MFAKQFSFSRLSTCFTWTVKEAENIYDIYLYDTEIFCPWISYRLDLVSYDLDDKMK